MGGYIGNSPNTVTPLYRKEYISPEQTITAAGSLTLAHGLGVRPADILVYIVCKTAEHGYSIGDGVVVDNLNSSDSASTRANSIVPDSTNLTVRFTVAPNAFLLAHKSTGTGALTTNANWRLVVRAWAEPAPVSPYEPELGNPSVDGFVLSSTAAGVRSWTSGGSLLAITTFTSTGSFTKATNNPAYVVVEVWGAGGGGGGSSATSSVAGGGGAGGYSKELIQAAALGASETVTIGAGGTAGSTGGGNGGTGGATSFGAFLSATGGNGGVGVSALVAALGGGGGSGSGGDINKTGGAGLPSTPDAGRGFSGAGGATALGGNGFAVLGNSNSTGTSATDNSGSGASGGAANAGSRSGGVGGSGFVVVYEYG